MSLLKDLNPPPMQHPDISHCHQGKRDGRGHRRTCSAPERNQAATEPHIHQHDHPDEADQMSPLPARLNDRPQHTRHRVTQGPRNQQAQSQGSIGKTRAKVDCHDLFAQDCDQQE